MSQEEQDLTPRRNAPPVTRDTGGNPARPSNALLMKYMDQPERYGAGYPVHYPKLAQFVIRQTEQRIRQEMQKQARAGLPQLHDTELRLLCKLAGEEREPAADRHGSSPDQLMRPRAELILFNRQGVYGIDKGDYLLFPGGGVDDGEQPRDAAIRETLEEANRHPINVEGAGVVEARWPQDSGNDFWDDSEFDGERTYFYLGVDSGEAGISHDDLEEFQVMPFDQVITRLQELLDDPDQAWAVRNNRERLNLVRRAKRMARTAENLRPIKQAQAVQVTTSRFNDTQDLLERASGRKVLTERQKRVNHWLDLLGEGALEVGPYVLEKVASDQPSLDLDIMLDQLASRKGLTRQELEQQTQELIDLGVLDDVRVMQQKLSVEKLTKAEADYQERPQDGQICAGCAHYRDGSCTQVQGQIQPNGWCTLWEAGQEKQAAEYRQVRHQDYRTDYTADQQGQWSDEINKDPDSPATEKPETADGSALPADGLTEAHKAELKHTQVEKQGQAIPGEAPPPVEDPELPGAAPQPARQFVQNLRQKFQPQQPAQPQAAQPQQPVQPQQKPLAPTGPTAPGQPKQADAATLLRRNQYLMVTPDGRVIARRLPHRRFTFPEQGKGRPAPYEDPVRYVPQAGVPEPGYHGYEVGLHVGQSPEVPEGWEALPAEQVMKDLYASMGLSANKPFRQLDRARARTLLRFLKKQKRERELLAQTEAV